MPRLVSLLEIVRAVWTVSAGIGTLLMLWLLRETMQDNWAIEQIRRPGTDVLRLQTRGEVTDQAMLTLAVASMCLAGGIAYIGLPELAAPLLVLTAAALVALGFIKLARRRRMFRSVRFNKQAR